MDVYCGYITTSMDLSVVTRQLAWNYNGDMTTSLGSTLQ